MTHEPVHPESRARHPGWDTRETNEGRQRETNEPLQLTLRGFLHFPRFCPFGGVWFAFGFGPGFGHSLSCGCWGQGPPLSALHLDFDFAWACGGSSSLSIVGYTLSVRSVPRYQLRPLSVLARIRSPELTRAVRCGARLQLREGSVNPPVKQT